MAAKRMKGKNEGNEIPNSLNNKKKTKKKKKKKSLFLKTVLILLAIIAILAGVIIGYGYSKYKLVDFDEIDLNEVEINDGISTTGYMNIALFGVDSRSDSYDNTRSDVIMIVSINQETGKVKIASVYRDTYLKVGNSFDKATHAYAKGGATLALSTLNTNLDLDITKYVTVNFNAVIDVIDEIEGIEIELTSAEIKYINGYIDELNKVTGHSSSHISSAGTYNLDGVQAVAYSRIRYTSGGDYKRTDRQREVLSLAFEKVKKMNVFSLNSLTDVVLNEISTNLTVNDIKGLLKKVTSYEIEETTGWPYEVEGYQPGSVWYAAPVNLAKQVSLLHEYLFDEEDYEASSTVQTISNRIMSETGYQ